MTPRKAIGRVYRRIRLAFGQIRKRGLARRMQRVHAQRIVAARGKKRIRVVFLAIHASVWKVDTVFRKMLADPQFDPIVLVCPYTPYGDDRMREESARARVYFEAKGYPLAPDGTSLDELEPDLVFFTNPHPVTRDGFYADAFTRYLSCYVPYFYLITTHGDDQAIYNRDFHNAMWKIFMPHAVAMEEARRVAANRGANCVLTGYPADEPLLAGPDAGDHAWKAQSCRKRRVIFAPHHTILERGLQLSTFLRFAEPMVELADATCDDIQWSFKPHPILKSKLYAHPEWGKQRTDAYYAWWRDSDHTQLDEGDYVELFRGSDALIHDSGSFIVEYLLVKKPCLYLLGDDTQTASINRFGREALRAYRVARDAAAIRAFIADLLRGAAGPSDVHAHFLSERIEPYHAGGEPSDAVLATIRSELA